MRKKIQLTIDEPCHENWDCMTPVEKGKFCGACQKQVVDFSNMSDRQVAEFFKKPIQSFSKGSSVCGRFMADQLDRPIEIPGKRIPWVKYFFQITLPAFLFSMKTSAQKTQGAVKVVTKDTTRIPLINTDYMVGMVARRVDNKPVTFNKIETTVKGEMKINTVPDTALIPLMGTIYVNTKIGNTPIPVSTDKKEIEGMLVDENNMPVSFANIETGMPGEEMMTDENGHFAIRKSWFSKGKELTFSSVGFEKIKIKAGEEQYVAGKLVVQLKSNVVLPEFIVCAGGGPRMGKITVGGIKRIQKEELNVRKTDSTFVVKEVELPVEENSLIVYPNPVQSGTAFKMDVRKLQAGNYQLQLLNQAGQLVQHKMMIIDSEASLLNVDVPVAPASSYFLLLINNKTGKKFTQKIIIQ